MTLATHPGPVNVWSAYQTTHRARFAVASSRLVHLASRCAPGSRVLTVGIGDGALESLLVARGCNVTAMDPSAESLAAVTGPFGRLLGRLEEIPLPSGSRDVVIASEVLEHLTPEQTAAGTAEARRVLVAGGRFLGTVPCAERLADSAFVCACCGREQHRWGHLQSFTAESLRAALGRSFAAVTVERRLFVSWGTLNWRGRAEGVALTALHALGALGDSRLHLAFEAR